MRKYIKLITVATLMMILIVGLASCGKAKVTSSGTLGDYEVSIDSAEIIEDPDDAGVSIIAVHYTYTNNSDSANSWLWSINSTAFQDGVEIEYEPVFKEGTLDSVDNIFTDVEAGKTMEVIETFKLNDTKNDVTIEVTSMMDDKPKLTKTFEIKV